MADTNHTKKTAASISPANIEPKRFALIFDPPTIVLEYLDRDAKRLRHRRMRVSRRTGDVDRAVRRLLRHNPTHLHSDVVSETQLRRLVEQLIKPTSSSPGAAPAAAEGSQPQQAAPEFPTEAAQNPSSDAEEPKQQVDNDGDLVSEVGDLNQVSEDELIRAKELMEVEFKKNSVLPGDDGYEHDKRMDFEVAEGAGDWDESDDSEGEQSEEEMRVAPSIPSMSSMAGAPSISTGASSTPSTPGPSVVTKVHATHSSLGCSELNFSPPPGSDDGGWCSPMQEEGPELTPSPSSGKGAVWGAAPEAEVESPIQPTPAVRMMNRPAKLGIVDKGGGLKSLSSGGFTGGGGSGVSPLDSAGSLGGKSLDSAGSLGGKSTGSLGSKSSLGSLSDLPSLGGRGLGKLSAPMGGGMGGGLGGGMGGGLGGGMGGGLVGGMGGGLGKISNQSLGDPFAKKKSPVPMSPEVNTPLGESSMEEIYEVDGGSPLSLGDGSPLTSCDYDDRF